MAGTITRTCAMFCLRCCFSACWATRWWWPCSRRAECTCSRACATTTCSWPRATGSSSATGFCRAIWATACFSRPAAPSTCTWISCRSSLARLCAHSSRGPKCPPTGQRCPPLSPLLPSARLRLQPSKAQLVPACLPASLYTQTQESKQ